MDSYYYRRRPDIVPYVALLFILFMGINVFQDLIENAGEPASQVDENLASALEPSVAQAKEPEPDLEKDPESISSPYKKYVLTQGPHGQSYGHLAIDLAAGKGAKVRSPIKGIVSDLYIDQWGNPTLVIENEVYQVTLMHGEYDVKVGEEVDLGQPVGIESNLGYTTDMQGRSCKNRNCGYHTHLNIFDKRAGKNVNPLELLDISR